MKKFFFMIVALVAIAAIAAAGSAMAARSWVFNDQQELTMKKAVCLAYEGRPVQFRFAGHDLTGSLVNCTTDDDEEYVQFFVFRSGIVQITEMGGSSWDMADRVQAFVQAALKPPASDPTRLGRNLLK